MNVLFVEIDTAREWAVASLGPACLASFIRRFGHEASLVRIAEDAPVDELAAVVASRSPDLIGVSLTSRQWLGAKRLLAGLRETSSVPVVAGGLHPTFAPEATLAAPGIDYVCLGEGEKAFLHLVEALAADVPLADTSLRNIWIEGGARPAMHDPFEPIDGLPYMARDMLDEQHGVVHMTTQRGCPFPCTYCAARMFDQLYADGPAYGRRRSHESVLCELETIQRDGQLNYVIFLDDTFTIHHPWVYEFCDVYRERVGVPFSMHARIETMNDKLIACLAAAGCCHITYGVESGSERVRRDVMKRPATNDKIVDVFERTRAAGIMPTANYMIGLPGETRADMDETIALHARIRPADFGYFVFYPYPGTPLFAVCRDAGYLPEDFMDRPANHRASILNLPDVTPDDIADVYDRWTAIRTRETLARYGDDCSEEFRAQAIETVERCAAEG